MTLTLPRLFISGVVLTFSVAVHADQKLMIITEQQAKDILLNKTYQCEWQDAYFNGSDRYTFNRVTLTHVSAHVTSSECKGTALYKGHFDNNELKGSVSGYNPSCGVITTEKTFYQKADGSVYYTGLYESHSYKATGIFRCKSIQ